jgi:hypothetical protein
MEKNVAIGPDSILSTMQKIADESELLIDEALEKGGLHLSIDSSIEISLDVAEIAPSLNQEIWNCMLRKKYILAGWRVADWIPATFEFERTKLKFEK